MIISLVNLRKQFSRALIAEPLLFKILFFFCITLNTSAQVDRPGFVSNPTYATAFEIQPDKALGKAGVIDPAISSIEHDTFELGCKFSIDIPVTITELGVYDVNDDGLTDTAIITIWNTTNHDAILTAMIQPGVEAHLINGFRYINVTDTRLQPGSYIMSAYIPGEGFGLNSGLTAITGSGITLNSGVYEYSHTYPGMNNYSHGFFGANFLYTSDEPAILSLGSVEEQSGIYELGFDFTVNSPLLISELGTYDAGQDGLEFEVPVTIWRESDQTSIISVTIPAGDTISLVNNFRYVTVNPFILQPGEYRISSFLNDLYFAFNEDANCTAVPQITVNSGAYSYSHQYPGNTYTSIYFGPNFIFSDPWPAITVPEIESNYEGVWELGYEFEVLEPITIIQLGTYDYEGNGLAVATPVTLWNVVDESIIVTTTLPAGTSSSLNNDFRYSNIPETKLLPGIYRISSYFNGDYFGVDSDINSEGIEEIRLIQGVYKEFQEPGYPAETYSYFYFGPNFIVKPSCAVADRPTLENLPAVCSGTSINLSIVGANLNDAETWQWYTDSCNGQSLGNGEMITITTDATTDIFVRGEGGCLDDGPCARFTINVVNEISILADGNILRANIPANSYQWINCGNEYSPVPGETRQEFLPLTNGYYAVIANFDSCSLQSPCYVYSLYSNIDQSTEGIKLYPNPGHDYLTIELEDAWENGTVEILDIEGQVIVRLDNINSNTVILPVNDLPSAMYLVRISDSHCISMVKFMKE